MRTTAQVWGLKFLCLLPTSPPGKHHVCWCPAGVQPAACRAGADLLCDSGLPPRGGGSGVGEAGASGPDTQDLKQGVRAGCPQARWLSNTATAASRPGLPPPGQPGQGVVETTLTAEMGTCDF